MFIYFFIHLLYSLIILFNSLINLLIYSFIWIFIYFTAEYVEIQMYLVLASFMLMWKLWMFDNSKWNKTEIKISKKVYCKALFALRTKGKNYFKWKYPCSFKRSKWLKTIDVRYFHTLSISSAKRLKNPWQDKQLTLPSSCFKVNNLLLISIFSCF